MMPIIRPIRWPEKTETHAKAEQRHFEKLVDEARLSRRRARFRRLTRWLRPGTKKARSPAPFRIRLPVARVAQLPQM